MVFWSFFCIQPFPLFYKVQVFQVFQVPDLGFRSSHCKLIWRLGDFNETQTHNHLVCKLTLTQLAKLTSLAKWLSVRLQTKWLRVRFRLQPRIYVIATVSIITRCHSRRYWEGLPAVSREVRRSRLFEIFVV